MVVPEDYPHNIHNKLMGTIDKDEINNIDKCHILFQIPIKSPKKCVAMKIATL
jgi:hypothetical protein